MNKEVNLASLEAGHTGIISSIIGGDNFVLKLESMGIRPGSRVTKISNLFYKGPVVIHVGGTDVAIGHRMAGKILVTPNPSEIPL
jgi:ferrous iron transport protein A